MATTSPLLVPNELSKVLGEFSSLGVAVESDSNGTHREYVVGLGTVGDREVGLIKLTSEATGVVFMGDVPDAYAPQTAEDRERTLTALTYLRQDLATLRYGVNLHEQASPTESGLPGLRQPFVRGVEGLERQLADLTGRPYSPENAREQVESVWPANLPPASRLTSAPLVEMSMTSAVLDQAGYSTEAQRAVALCGIEASQQNETARSAAIGGLAG